MASDLTPSSQRVEKWFKQWPPSRIRFASQDPNSVSFRIMKGDEGPEKLMEAVHKLLKVSGPRPIKGVRSGFAVPFGAWKSSFFSNGLKWSYNEPCLRFGLVFLKGSKNWVKTETFLRSILPKVFKKPDRWGLLAFVGLFIRLIFLFKGYIGFNSDEALRCLYVKSWMTGDLKDFVSHEDIAGLRFLLGCVFYFLTGGWAFFGLASIFLSSVTSLLWISWIYQKILKTSRLGHGSGLCLSPGFDRLLWPASGEAAGNLFLGGADGSLFR